MTTLTATITKGIVFDRETITPELTREAEMLFYRLRSQGDRVWNLKRATRPGVERERLSLAWKRTEHARERAYQRMTRRRAVTGWTYQES